MFRRIRHQSKIVGSSQLDGTELRMVECPPRAVQVRSIRISPPCDSEILLNGRSHVPNVSACTVAGCRCHYIPELSGPGEHSHMVVHEVIRGAAETALFLIESEVLVA